MLGDEFEGPRLDGVRDVGAAELEDLGGRDDRPALFVPELQKPGDALGGRIALV